MSQGIWAPYIEEFLYNAGLKFDILKRMYVLTRAFAIQKFGRFWKLISTSILNKRTDTFMKTKFNKLVQQDLDNFFNEIIMSFVRSGIFPKWLGKERNRCFFQ